MIIASFGIAEPEAQEACAPEPLPEALFEKPPVPSEEAPEWIVGNPEFKSRHVVDDGDIVLDFTAVKMNAKSKYQVDGAADHGERWGYRVTAKGRPFGWVVMLEPGTVLVTGAGANKYTKHRSLMSAMFRLSSYIQTAGELV